MSESELKTALQHEGERQARDFWQSAEATVAKRREEIETQRVLLCAEAERRLQTEITLLRNNLLFAAQAMAMKNRLHAEAALEERMMLLAQQQLPELAAANREALWQALCAELPATEARSLKVHPADQTLAARDFPTAEIECDASLGGGLIVTSGDKTIRIDNSLRCRLLRAWPDLLPKLLAQLRKQVDHNETTRSDTSS